MRLHDASKLLLAGILAAPFLQCSAPEQTAQAEPEPASEPETITMVATAYSIKGKTKTGDDAKVGVVAVDPRVIPLGSTIWVEGAGEYSGEYEAIDTGKSIKGQRIDIFMKSKADAREFGRQEVEVAVLETP